METKIKQICKEKQPFERLEMTKDELREMFAYNQFKLRIINEKIDTDKTTVYRCGSLIDLCRGPHVRNTGKIKAIKVTKVSTSTITLLQNLQTNFLILSKLSRTHQHTGKAKLMLNHCSVFTVFHSLIQNSLRNGKSSKKRLPNEITVKLVVNKNCFSFTNCRQAVVSFCRVALTSTTL